MDKFTQRSVFTDNAKRLEAIRLYAHEKKSFGQISLVFNCRAVDVERMLNAQGQLL